MRAFPDKLLSRLQQKRNRSCHAEWPANIALRDQERFDVQQQLDEYNGPPFWAVRSERYKDGSIWR